MAFTLGQHTHTHAAVGTAVGALAYVSAITAGNLLISVQVSYGTGSTITSAMSNTGTAGAQVWHPLLAAPFSSSTDAATTDMFWAVASGSGTCSTTITWNQGVNGTESYVSEWSGSSITSGLTQDGTGQHNDGTAASIILPSITTTFADSLVFGYVSSANAGTVNSPWTQVDVDNGDEWFYRADLAAGAYTPNVTQTSGTYSCIMAALGTPPVLALRPNLPFMAPQGGIL